MKESHYNKGGIEVIDFIRDQLTPEEFNGFCKGNILKYVPRSNHKGDPIADAQKVRDYADYWINANLRAKPTFEVTIEEVQEAALEKAGLRFAEKDQEIYELRRECRSYEETLKIRNDEIESMKEFIADRSNELVQKHETIQKLETKNKQLNSLAEMRLTKFESLVLVKRELEAEIARLKDDKAELKTVIERLKVEINGYSNEVRNRGNERHRKDNLIKKLDADLKKAEKARFNSVKMAEALRESVDRLQKEKAELEEKEDVIESLESQVGALLTEVKQREAENEKLKKDLGLNLPSNIDPSGRIAPADDVPDIDAILPLF